MQPSSRPWSTITPGASVSGPSGCPSRGTRGSVGEGRDPPLAGGTKCQGPVGVPPGGGFPRAGGGDPDAAARHRRERGARHRSHLSRPVGPARDSRRSPRGSSSTCTKPRSSPRRSVTARDLPTCWRGRSHRCARTARYDRAVEIGERALALAKEVGDARLNALARMELSSVHLIRGDMRLARGPADRRLCSRSTPCRREPVTPIASGSGAGSSKISCGC